MRQARFRFSFVMVSVASLLIFGCSSLPPIFGGGAIPFLGSETLSATPDDKVIWRSTQVNKGEIDVLLFDMSDLDTDRCRLEFNGKVVPGYENFDNNNGPQRIRLTLEPGINRLVLVALTEGSNTPNTSMLSIDWGQVIPPGAHTIGGKMGAGMAVGLFITWNPPATPVPTPSPVATPTPTPEPTLPPPIPGIPPASPSVVIHEISHQQLGAIYFQASDYKKKLALETDVPNVFFTLETVNLSGKFGIRLGRRDTPVPPAGYERRASDGGMFSPPLNPAFSYVGVDGRYVFASRMVESSVPKWIDRPSWAVGDRSAEIKRAYTDPTFDWGAWVMIPANYVLQPFYMNDQDYCVLEFNVPYNRVVP